MVFVPPVRSGEVVYIKEPWIRLKNLDGSPLERIRFAVDSVVSEGQQTHKWFSPISMPENAVRRFAVAGVDEEAELRRILEAAGVQVLTTEEQAKERLEAKQYAPAAPSEIAEADQKTRIFEALEEEDEILAADEMELDAYLDAAVTKSESEPQADSAKPPDGEGGTEDADGTDDTEEPPEEDRENRAIPIITEGLFPYCGQVMEVGPCTSQTVADEAAL